MARAGLGRRMRLVARGEHHAVVQAREAAGVVLAVFGEQIGRELVDRDRHDQRRRVGARLHRGRRAARGGLGRGAGGERQRERGGQGEGGLERGAGGTVHRISGGNRLSLDDGRAAY